MPDRPRLLSGSLSLCVSRTNGIALAIAGSRPSTQQKVEPKYGRAGRRNDTSQATLSGQGLGSLFTELSDAAVVFAVLVGEGLHLDGLGGWVSGWVTEQASRSEASVETPRLRLPA